MESFRFKVVKIISKEPFKRGRWLCMDFQDPPSNGTTNIEDCLAHNHPDITSSTGQGVSAVAIDNKIEQAMDLVKSHLMFAVREEMDVLKEEILKLTELNSRLERENQIFRAHATVETLNLVDQFNQQAQIQPRQNSPSNQITTNQIISQAQIATLPIITSQQQTITTTSPQITQQITTSAISTINSINSMINTAHQINQPQINQSINSQQLNNQSQQLNQPQPLNQQQINQAQLT